MELKANSYWLLFQDTRTGICDKLEDDLVLAGAQRERYLAEARENGVDDEKDRPFYRLYAIYVLHLPEGAEENVATCIWDIQRGWQPFADRCLRH